MSDIKTIVDKYWPYAVAIVFILLLSPHTLKGFLGTIVILFVPGILYIAYQKNKNNLAQIKLITQKPQSVNPESAQQEQSRSASINNVSTGDYVVVKKDSEDKISELIKEVLLFPFKVVIVYYVSSIISGFVFNPYLLPFSFLEMLGETGVNLIMKLGFLLPAILLSWIFTNKRGRTMRVHAILATALVVLSYILGGLLILNYLYRTAG
jgi:hypothetical protein